MNKIAAIVVTYNRKVCLATCLEAICRQSMLPDVIYVVDNHSTDGTAKWLLEQQYIAGIPNANNTEDIVSESNISSLNTATAEQSILFKYIYKAINDGGAGGFYAGMKTAYDDGYEWLWLMDDDGVPAEDSLEQLFFHAVKNNLYYVNALVVDIESRFLLSFGDKNIDDYKGLDLAYGYACPFNGTFINRQIPAKIGFIKKEMFIWGDDVEYQEKTVKTGFRIATVTSSIHYHPRRIVAELVRVIPFLKRPQVQIFKTRANNIIFRNMGYNYYHYFGNGFHRIFLYYILYFLLRLKFSECKTFITSFINGSRNKFV
jgi:GT2 family glycosyltransferase